MQKPSVHRLEIVVQNVAGSAKVIRVSGSASMDTGNQLRDQLVGLLEPGTSRLVLDLTDLEFINSVGLGAIIAAHLRCRRASAEIHLANPQPAIRELLDVTSLTKLFPIHDSVDLALAKC